jgi:hypothetical protein
MLVARGGGDRVVQCPVGEPRGRRPVGLGVGGQRLPDRRVVRGGASSSCGAGDQFLYQRTIVVQRLDFPPDRLQDPLRGARVDRAPVRDERAPGPAPPGLDDAERGEPRQGLPDRGAADPQHLGQFPLGGKLLAWLEHAHGDRRQDALRDRLGGGPLPGAGVTPASGHRRFGHGDADRSRVAPQARPKGFIHVKGLPKIPIRCYAPVKSVRTCWSC